MDKSCPDSIPNPNPNPNTSNSGGSGSGSGSGGNTKDHHYLNQLNKFSHKISKPPIRKPPPFDHLPLSHHQSLLLDDSQSQPSTLQHQHQHQHQHQPPVYNINKNDFRDVVQKLTGSPAHDRLSAPPPIQPPKPPSSRLQKIRPPPLEHLNPRPSPLLNDPLLPQNPTSAVGNGTFFGSQRQLQPLSPLPPFPAVHAAAESPISAYMRYLQTSSSSVDSDPRRLSGPSPRWSSFAQPPVLPSPTSGAVPPLHFPTTSSPLPFGCLPSPRSPYPLLSPSSLFSAANQFGFQQFPLSPTPPAPSPRWKSR